MRLTCNGLPANSSRQTTWFRRDQGVETSRTTPGSTYEVRDSGDYQCQALGSRRSDPVTLVFSNGEQRVAGIKAYDPRSSPAPTPCSLTHDRERQDPGICRAFPSCRLIKGNLRSSLFKGFPNLFPLLRIYLLRPP